MCDKIDGWNPADIEAGGEGIEGYQAQLQGRQGGPFKEIGEKSRHKHVDAYNAKADWAGESEEVDKHIFSKTPNRKMAKSWEKTKHPLIMSTFGPTIDVTRDSGGKVVGVKTTSTSY